MLLGLSWTSTFFPCWLWSCRLIIKSQHQQHVSQVWVHSEWVELKKLAVAWNSKASTEKTSRVLPLSREMKSSSWCSRPGRGGGGYQQAAECRGTDEGSELPVNYNQECRKLQFSRGHSRWCSETVEDKQERMELKLFFPPDKKKNSNIYLISLSMFKNLALIMCLT